MKIKEYKCKAEELVNQLGSIEKEAEGTPIEEIDFNDPYPGLDELIL